MTSQTMREALLFRWPRLYRLSNNSSTAIDLFISVLGETLNRVKKENKLLHLTGNFNFDLLDPDRHTDIVTDHIYV